MYLGIFFFVSVNDRNHVYNMDPIVIIAGAVLGMDALFLAWVCRCEEDKKEAQRRRGYVPV